MNIYDDFKEDERLAQLLERYSGSHLVLNGDIFDLLKVPVMGQFPDEISQRLAGIKLFKCLKGHPRVIQALSRFLKNEASEITYLPGNHDMELLFPGPQALFTRFISGQETHPRVKFITDQAHPLQYHFGRF